MSALRSWGRAAVLLSLPTALLAAAGCSDSNGPAAGTASNVVYSETNAATPNGNGMLAFRASSAGGLTALSGSPFATGGAGVNEAELAPTGVLDNDTPIAVNQQRTLLFAVNQGSDTVAVFRINSDGSLTAVPGSPFNSGGAAPTSVAVFNNTLLVANKAQDPARPALFTGTAPNVTSFTIGTGGVLMKDATLSMAVGSSPGQVLFSPDSTLAFVEDFQGDLKMHVIQVGSSGQLTEAPGSPRDPSSTDATIFAGTTGGHNPLGLGVFPSAVQRLLYVNFPLTRRLGIYTYDAFGNLTLVGSVANPGAAACWIVISHDGRWLYTANAVSGSITVFSLANPGAPAVVQTVNVTATSTPGTLNGNPKHEAFDPSGRFLYVLTPRDLSSTPAGQGNTLHVFAVDSGTGQLTEVSTSPTTLPLPSAGLVQPQGVVAI